MVYCLNPACLEQQDATATNYCRDCGSALTLAGRYRAESVLGESSLGRTLIATDRGNTRCVIKQIYKRSSGSEPDDFEQNVQRLRKLGEHPQIPSVLDAVEDEQLGQFLIQELVSGENLLQWVERKGPLEEAEVRSLLKSLLSVLEYVHSFKIIHRDIKPNNIILQANKPPVLVDFGAARSIRKSSAKTVIGSADYAAPEQSMGQATFASDLYSLGLTCLYALTSVAPFTLYSAAEDRWVWKDYLTQPVEAHFAAVLDKLVAQPLQQRFESAQQAAAALKGKNAIAFLSDVLPKKFSPQTFIPSSLVPDGLVERIKESAVPLTRSFQSFQGRATELPRPVVTATQKWTKQYQVSQSGGVRAIALPSYLQPYCFAVAAADSSIHLRNLSDGQLIHTFPRRRVFGEGHSAPITALCFHGRVLYSASEDGTIKEWDSAECRLLNTMPTRGWIPTDLKATADGAQLISPNSDGQIVVWDIATLLPAAQLAQHQRRVNAIALSSGMMASASEDGTVKLWRTIREEQNKLLLAETIKTEETVRFLSIYTKNAQRYLVVASRSEVKRYTLDSRLNSCESSIVCRSAYPITALSLSSDGYLMLGSEDRFVTVWEIDSQECVAQLAHEWGVVAIAASDSGQKVITASADEVVTVWHHQSSRK